MYNKKDSTIMVSWLLIVLLIGTLPYIQLRPFYIILLFLIIFLDLLNGSSPGYKQFRSLPPEIPPKPPLTEGKQRTMVKKLDPNAPRPVKPLTTLRN